MDGSRGWVGRRTYVARFEDGPRDGSLTAVLALESGQPPEVLLTPGRRDWTYILAGAERMDGSVPYLWMPKAKVDVLLREPVRARARK